MTNLDWNFISALIKVSLWAFVVLVTLTLILSFRAPKRIALPLVKVVLGHIYWVLALLCFMAIAFDKPRKKILIFLRKGQSCTVELLSAIAEMFVWLFHLATNARRSSKKATASDLGAEGR
ncbi:MAG TPA: hypothetical protein DIW46_02045 [Microbacterium sp.]|nr:hypothetical protein [Microbacterium sp.]